MKIGIVGAGLAGRLLASRLVHLKHHLTLFDKEPLHSQKSCGWAAAGMISPFAEVDTEPLVFSLGQQSLALWPRYLADLPFPVYYQANGSLLVAHARDREEITHFKKRLLHRTPTIEIQNCDKKTIQSLEPELSATFTEGLFFPQEARLDNQTWFEKVGQWLVSQGVNWQAEVEIQQLEPFQITTASQTEKFDWVVDCRGLGAQTKLPELRGVRGELILVEAPDVHLNRAIRLLHPRYPIYIAPRAHPYYLIGATMIESQDHSPISVRSLLELLSAAYSLHPGFAEARVISSRTQCRPAFPDNLPRIISEPGLTQLNGLYRHGYLLAPALVEQVIALIA